MTCKHLENYTLEKVSITTLDETLRFWRTLSLPRVGNINGRFPGTPVYTDRDLFLRELIYLRKKSRKSREFFLRVNKIDNFKRGSSIFKPNIPFQPASQRFLRQTSMSQFLAEVLRKTDVSFL